MAGAYSSTGTLWLLYSNKCTLLTCCRYTAIQVQVAIALCHSGAVCVQSHSVHKQHFISSINKSLTIEIKSITSSYTATLLFLLHTAGETNFISHDNAYTQPWSAYHYVMRVIKGVIKVEFEAHIYIHVLNVHPHICMNTTRIQKLSTQTIEIFLPTLGSIRSRFYSWIDRGTV